jgi:hypothetical protein
MTAFNIKGAWRRAALIGLIFSGAFAGCATGSDATTSQAKLAKAQALFAERCKNSGEKIVRTANDQDGIFLLRVRPLHQDYDGQFSADDPYGNDSAGDGYIETFLRGGYDRSAPPVNSPSHIGFLFVDAVDPRDGVRYRYTGRVEEPWQFDKHYLKGYTRFVISRQPTDAPAPRYGVTYQDISTRADREFWIAGSSLKIVDLKTNEVVAERIGYMFDERQGDRVGGRSPWIFAANNACPRFSDSKRAALSQFGQADKFVEKVIIPSGGGK